MRAVRGDRVLLKLLTPYMSMTIEPITSDEDEGKCIYMELPLRMKE